MAALPRISFCAALICCTQASIIPTTVLAQRLSPASTSDVYDRALNELQEALKQQTGWVKVHAAEALLSLSHGEDVHAIYEEELSLHGNEPQTRIGARRILARTENTKENRDRHLTKLWQICCDPQSRDSIHAAEALAKLGYAIPEKDCSQFLALVQNTRGFGAPYRRWLQAVSGDEVNIRFLAELLDNHDADIRGNAAYALRHLAKLPRDVVTRLVNAATNERDSAARVYLLSACFVTVAEEEQAKKFKEQLLPYLSTGTSSEKYEVTAAFAQRGSMDDVPFLTELLQDTDADVRVGAANAIMRIDRRMPLPFAIIDWLALVGYGLAMLGVGWYFSRRTSNTEDYLLAGRNMKPWAVGLSYFATMFSTISYLAIPGEMIQNGPMIFSQVLVYPLIFVVVTRGLIPHIMRLRVTSAYEILEMRLGLSVRMLGATFFLALRIVWMSFIIFATSKHILVPLLRLDDSTTPWVAVILGMVTVAYTSMGGLRAVIWTDVAQAFIMLFGAILSIVMISIDLGGPMAWWPSTWSSNWEQPKFWFDPSARVTMAMAMLSAFVWYICTAGSDQMAIQRYLATRDVAAARRMYGISLWCDVVSAVLLAALGLALFAYFQANPRFLPDGCTVTTGGDRLLPQYIVKGLPAGVSGLIVAGLLAAAMSSLSSGLSSSCSVITVDWIDRFRKKRLKEADHVRLARQVTWVIGLAIVSLSFIASRVQGNLLEVAQKLVNLLTAPLFVLFFMAMFVPWATTIGTWAAGLSSAATAVIISYTDVVHLSFLWIMPMSTIIGIATGCFVSLLPFGRRRPVLEVAAETVELSAK